MSLRTLKVISCMFVACSTNAGEVQVNLIWTLGGRVEEWHLPRKPQVREYTTDCKHGPWND